MELNSVHSAREGLKVVDLLIEPEVKQFSILDFHAYKPIMEIGYETALAPLRVWGKIVCPVCKLPELDKVLSTSLLP